MFSGCKGAEEVQDKAPSNEVDQAPEAALSGAAPGSDGSSTDGSSVPSAEVKLEPEDEAVPSAEVRLEEKLEEEKSPDDELEGSLEAEKQVKTPEVNAVEGAAPPKEDVVEEAKGLENGEQEASAGSESAPEVDPKKIDDLKKKPKGPDGVKEAKNEGKFLPDFPPKEANKDHLPEGVGEQILDPRIAPDADAALDTMRVPLGKSSDTDESGLLTVPSALSFQLSADGASSHQRMRLEAKEPLEVKVIALENSGGSFRLSNVPKLPYVLAIGEAVFLTIESVDGTGPEETSLNIETNRGKKAVPVRYAKSAQ